MPFPLSICDARVLSNLTMSKISEKNIRMKFLRRLAIGCLSGLLLVLAASSWSSAETTPSLVPDHPNRAPLHLVATRSQKSKPTSPTVIQNLRFHTSTEYTRLVFDLGHSITFTETRSKHPDQAVIAVNNAVLGKAARAQLKSKTFPSAVQIAQLRSKTVSVLLSLKALNKYTLFALTNPDRLVLDLYPHNLNKSRKPTTNLNGSATAASDSPSAARLRSKDKPLLIVIDPGHGGKDPGALGRKGTKEKHITLQIARKLKDLLTKRLGANVLLTRDRDNFVELEKRTEFANSKEADLFVSIHANAHRQRKVKGLELYHFGKASDPRALEVAARENGTPLDKKGAVWQYILADKLHDKKIEESRELTWTTRKTMVRHLKKHYKINDHGVKTAPFYVLRFTTMPSMLAEVAYLSNPTEEKRLRSQTFQRHLAESLFQGIQAYLTPILTAAR